MGQTKREPAAAAKAREAAAVALVASLADGRLHTLGGLFAAAGTRLDHGTVRRLAEDAAVFVRSPKDLTLTALGAVHVSSRAAAADAVASDEVLVGILRRMALSGKTKAHAIGKVVEAVAAKDRTAFRDSLTARVQERRWPEGVGALHGRTGPLVFLLEDVVSSRPARVETGGAATRRGDNGGGFAAAFDRAFDRLQRERGLNLVALSALRSALPDFPRETFDRELHALRTRNHVVLHTFNERHGKLAPEELAAAIDEGGRRFVYAALRDPT